LPITINSKPSSPLPYLNYCKEYSAASIKNSNKNY
jgi:hypothetical protein